MTTTLKGHLADGSSVQKHSAGEIYPSVLVGFGDDTWAVQSPDGTQTDRYLTPGGALLAHKAETGRYPTNAELGRPYADLDAAHAAINASAR